MQNTIESVLISGAEVLPIIEGGKGVSASDGFSSGAFAAAGAVGTFSGANPRWMDENGKVVPLIYHGKTRVERHEELIYHSIKASISQARIAHDISKGRGRIHINVLWEMGGAQRILQEVLAGAKGLIHGVTCGAGMPYRLAEIAAQYQVYYYPIVSSARAFKALWKRSYQKVADLLGGVVYEDPWLAGGHNGLSNSEDPEAPVPPYERVVELRSFMDSVQLSHVPVIMAGGVWHLNEWDSWLNNKNIGNIAFQFGTRPLLTKESPIPDSWKQKLLTLKRGDIFLNRFSPTGFYSSAVQNNFIAELQERNHRQVRFGDVPSKEFSHEILFGPRNRKIYVEPQNAGAVSQWLVEGYTELMKTPDSTVIFVSKEKSLQIRNDQINCMGCLSHCRFSNWKDHNEHTTGAKPDPRSFCIQRTLQSIVDEGDVANQLMFSGHNAYRFAEDRFYDNGYVPTVQELIDRILTGY